MITRRPTQPDPPLPPSITPAALKLREACTYLGGISPITLRRLIGRGLIKPNRALRHILIPVSELDRFISSGGRL
jgi:hypothetical protein